MCFVSVLQNLSSILTPYPMFGVTWFYYVFIRGGDYNNQHHMNYYDSNNVLMFL